MNKREGLREQLQQMIRKAFCSLKAAQRHIGEGDYDFASSRAYYAAFYATQAILLTGNLSFSKHAGVISAFNQHFVRTAIFPKEFRRSSEPLVTHLEERRLAPIHWLQGIFKRPPP